MLTPASSSVGADRDHQRQQMVLGGVRDASARGARPVEQGLAACRGGGIDDVAGQPVVELARRSGAGRAEQPEVVEREAAADDEHAFVAQRGECTSDGEVLRRVVAMAQRELQDRDLCVGVHDVERCEHAVVVATRGIRAHRDAGAVEQLADACRHLGRSGRGVLDPVGEVGEAAVVVEHRGVRGALDGELGRLPVSRHHEDGLGRHAELLRDRLQRPFELVEVERHLVLHPGPRPATVGDEVRRKSGARVLSHHP